ncbi:MAG: phosphoribosylglycinamide formyltransferase [Fimbriimonas ginsengisoli]|uniref:phosphoribosylglycinamide formyltransferase 1 n=1 Tax=Fimbriimonas ginsengisoli TaxID=1005039 RepID=A0A931M1V0_FIMGI|nr:phosphoribosylglycinamide formyltransferase [Fimbriimonas ginsengisoli]
MAAIACACAEGRIPARVGVIVSPVDGTPAVEAAREMGITVQVVPTGNDSGPRLVSALQGCDLVCLAGYLRLLPNEVLRAFQNRILNIHPALLPRFGGKGMYGMRVHEAVLAAGVSESGCTVHLVNERYDGGRILLQRRVPVLPGDTPETLAARVLKEEHRAYPEAIAQVLHELEAGTQRA